MAALLPCIWHKVDLSVTVVEKDYVGRHGSGGNAGGIHRLSQAFPEIPLSVASEEIWSEIENLVDNDCMFRPCNQIKVAENEDEFRQLSGRNQKVRNMGFDHE